MVVCCADARTVCLSTLFGPTTDNYDDGDDGRCAVVSTARDAGGYRRPNACRSQINRGRRPPGGLPATGVTHWLLALTLETRPHGDYTRELPDWAGLQLLHQKRCYSVASRYIYIYSNLLRLMLYIHRGLCANWNWCVLLLRDSAWPSSRG